MSGEGESELNPELRQFVYLDSIAVNSLLASLYMSIPEGVEQVVEESDEGQKRKQGDAGLTLGNILRLGGLRESTDMEREMEQTTTTNRINDQYRFTILHDALSNYGEITDLTSEEPDSVSLNPSDVIKIQGNCRTDPLYRVLGSASLLGGEKEEKQESRDFSNLFGGLGENPTEQEEQTPDEQKEEVYNGMVGFELTPDNEVGPFGMVLREEELWIDPRREFLGPQKYTVLARVEGKIPPDGQWDLVDVLRVLGGILPPNKLNQVRESMLDDLFEDINEDQIDQIVNELLVEELMNGKVTRSDLEQRKSELREEAIEYYEEKEGESGDGWNPAEYMDRADFAVEEGYIVNPIAVYW